MALRDHEPIVIDKFNGLWAKGDRDNTPLDHFQDCNNIKYIGVNSFGTRDGIDVSQDVAVPLSNVKRIYNYPTQTANTLIVLTVESINVIGNPISVYGDLNYDNEENSYPIIGPSGVAGTISPVASTGYTGTPGILLNSIENESWETKWFNGSILSNNLVLVGRIYHVIDETLVYGPILSIVGMTDFAFANYAGRGYISPFTSFTVGDLTIEKGLNNEYLYVYAGDGTAARRAAGPNLVGTITVGAGAAGHTDAGLHIYAFVGETSSGYLTPPAGNATFTNIATNSVSFGSVPTGDVNVVKRHLVATIAIPSFNGDLNGYEFFFVPNATINNNTDTFLNNISFYDADLLDDASHLIDNFALIPAGASLNFYHNRLCLATTYTDISLVYVSAPGEPEAISQIDGLIIAPLDGNPITNGQELRDVLYIFKRSRTLSYIDNGDVPSSWPLVIVDNALGTCVHGISTVLDSGSASIDYLIIATYQGISLFNGKYIVPELSWKIDAYWKSLSRNDFGKIQIINAPIQKEIYIILPNRVLLVGNYANGMDQRNIRWALWTYQMGVNTVAVANIDEIILGADLPWTQ